MNERSMNVGNILERLNNKSISQYGYLINEGYKTIAGIRAKVDKDGKVIDEKAKKIIEKRLGKSIDEATKEDETEREIYEDKWVTIHGTHILVDDEGNIKDENLRNKINGTESSKKSTNSKINKKEVEDGLKALSKHYIYELRTGTSPQRVIPMMAYTDSYKYGSPDEAYHNVKKGLKKEIASKSANDALDKVLDNTLKSMKDCFKDYKKTKRGEYNHSVSNKASDIYSKFEKDLSDLGMDKPSIESFGKQLGLNYTKSSYYA